MIANRFSLILSLVGVYFTVYVFFSVTPAYADNETFKRSLDDIYQPVLLVKFAHIPLKAPLDAAAADDLNHARSVLVSFLSSYRSKTENPLDYLDTPLREEYPDRHSLSARVFHAESLTMVAIVDFLIRGSNNKEIVFYVLLTSVAEGDYYTKYTSFALVKRETKWKVARFADQIKPWRIESMEE